MRICLLVSLVVAAACEGPAGPAGPPGTGSDGSDGPPGAPGAPGKPDPSPWLTSPGVKLTVTGASIDATGATIAFKLADPAGVPLDRSGRLTSGTVATSFVLAQLAENPDGSPAQYTAYTTNTASQAAAESVADSFAVVDVTAGTYTYKLAAPLTGIDLTRTQTVLALATRTVATVQTFDRQTFSVRPGSTTPPIARELVTDATCDGCHKTLAAHGGRYTSPQQCVLCHQPQSIDPESGNTVDFKVMIHKLHRGEALPSVAAAPPFNRPYQIIGFGGSVNDFSTVAFPQNIARCESCHAGAQGDRWKTAITKVACASCHDTTVFSSAEVGNGNVLHRGGQQLTEGSCNVCHGPTSVLFPVSTVHYTGLLAPGATTLSLEITSITSTAPGQTPVLTFVVKVSGVPADILTTPLTRLTATIAGPTTDIATAWQARIQGAPTVGTLAAVDAASGVFAYTFPAAAAIPLTATGSYEVGLEGYISPAPVPPATTSPRYAAVNPVFAFAVTDATADKRREIVALASCNGCHGSLAAHGGARTNPQYCVFCHNTTGVNDRTARFEAGAALEEPLDFRIMIHKIHRGEQLTQPYAIGGTAGTAANPAGAPSSFNGVRYPRTTGDCAACHITSPAKTWTLPMNRSAAYAPSTMVEMTCSEPVGNDPNAYCDNPFWTATATTKLGPATSVCTSCHDAPDVAAHAAINTAGSGAEACATCHGPGGIVDVALFHALP